MNKYFISLEIKEFFRSPRFAKRLFVKIITFIAYLYFSALAIMFGIGAYYGVKEELPDENVLLFGSRYLMYFFFVFFVLYLFFNPSPSLKVRSLMILPIKKKKILNYFLLKLHLNYLSFFSLLAFITYTIVLFFNEDSSIGVVAWLLSVLAVIFSLVFIAYLAEKSYLFIAIVLFLLGTIIGLKHYGYLDITAISGDLFYSVYLAPWKVIFFVIGLCAVFYFTYHSILSRFYIDGAMRLKTEKVMDVKLNWLDRFGTTAVFLKNDIRMIIRNKRPRNAALFSFYFLFYGFWVFNLSGDSITGNVFKELFGGMLITGGFLFNFGNFVPGWDSEYYRLFMSQNVKYRQYLESKWWLMSGSVIFFLILSLPFLYFGLGKYLLILALAIFNIGFNSYLVLVGGVFNDNPVRLNEKVRAFQNSGGFNFKTMILGILRLIIPILIYYFAKKYFSAKIGLMMLFIIGVIGLLLKSIIMEYIEGLYVKRKYSLLESFAKEE